MSDSDFPKLAGDSVAERRMWGAMMVIVAAIGGWWLQNQYDTLLRQQEQISKLQDSISDTLRFIDDRYVEKDFLQALNNQSNRRFDALETKLDRVLLRLTEIAPAARNGNGIHPHPHPTPNNYQAPTRRGNREDL